MDIDTMVIDGSELLVQRVELLQQRMQELQGEIDRSAIEYAERRLRMENERNRIQQRLDELRASQIHRN